MTHTARTKIAAAVVVLFLAALSAAGLLSSHTVTPGAGVSGQAPSALHATPGAAQIHLQPFEHDSND